MISCTDISEPCLSDPHLPPHLSGKHAMVAVRCFAAIFIIAMPGPVLGQTEQVATQTDAQSAQSQRGDDSFTPLFPEDGVPEDWVVTTWDDLSKPAGDGARWKIVDGVLRGSRSRGTWLVSKQEYSDFELRFEFKLGELGNSGLALRAPMSGDPAFDGMDLQMADFRYNPQATDAELTGGIYRAIAPREQVYRPTEWNRYEVRLEGRHLFVKLNDVVIHDTNLDQYTDTVKRHDGSDAPPIKDRPRRGHIGFQELSRGDNRVQIRNARIRVLELAHE